jgi:hypothetical protein
LLAWILKNWPCPRLALALDATSLADRLTVLSLSLVYRGTAIPIAWKVLRGNRPHSWKPERLKLLRWFADQVDPTWTVRNDRSWPVGTVAVPGDRRLGLAPDDARDTAGQIPPRGLESAPIVLAVRPSSLKRSDGVPVRGSQHTLAHEPGHLVVILRALALTPSRRIRLLPFSLDRRYGFAEAETW